MDMNEGHKVISKGADSWFWTSVALIRTLLFLIACRLIVYLWRRDFIALLETQQPPPRFWNLLCPMMVEKKTETQKDLLLDIR